MGLKRPIHTLCIALSIHLYISLCSKDLLNASRSQYTYTYHYVQKIYSMHCELDLLNTVQLDERDVFVNHVCFDRVIT
jgi:hypothetical protein